MRLVALILSLAAFLVGSRVASAERFGALHRRIRDWFEETHSSPFELRRHFFRRFFDSELISDSNQAKVVAGGVLAILVSLSIMYSQSYFHKYAFLNGLDDPRGFNQALLADVAFLVALNMAITALFTTFQWPALFPGLRDYLALAGLPLRMRDIFVAKFVALVAFASLMIAGVAALPSVMLPGLMAGRYATAGLLEIPGLFVAMSLGGLFIFFTLVTVQGVLLNIVPVRQFPRVSLTLQGALLIVLVCALPFVISIADLAPYMSTRPWWLLWAPPLWFLGVNQIIVGNFDPLAWRLSEIALASVVLSAALAVLTYLWSYRRHRTRVLESPGGLESTGAASRNWTTSVAQRLVPDSRGLAVAGFIAKSLARSRQHRMILTTFAGLAFALICEGFFSLLLGGDKLHFAVASPGFRQAVIAVPLALSLFILAGFRYLFRLPVELRANWVFRIHEPGHAPALLAGVESFMTFWGVLPVAVLTLPLEIALLGWREGPLAALICLLASLTLMEFLLFQIERIPFTSSYFPGKNPPVETAIKYGLASFLYVGALSSLIRGAILRPSGTILILLVLAAVWLRLRFGRAGSRQFVRLEFEELAEPAVQLLGLEGD